MSEQPLRPFIPAWLDDAGLTATQFRVFSNLNRRAGIDGKCYPSAPSIATTCGIHKDTVWSCLRSLEDRGLIVRLPKKFGRSNGYLIGSPIGGKGGVIDEQPIGGIQGPVDSHQSAESDGRQSAESKGRQSAESDGRKGYPSKGIQLRASNRDLFDIEEHLPFASEAFREAWGDWIQHLKEKKKAITPTARKAQFKTLKAMGEARAVIALGHSTAQSYAGVYEPKPSSGSTSKPSAPVNTGNRPATYETIPE
jgi:hypothetical protein